MHSKGLWIAAAVLAGFALVAPMASAASRDTGNGGGPSTISAAFFEDFVATREAVRLWADQHATAALEKARGNERNDDGEKVKADPAETKRQNNHEDDPADQPEAVSLRPVSTPLSLTGSARPGWGCGDTKHEHQGPPGRPDDATSPCDKNAP